MTSLTAALIGKGGSLFFIIAFIYTNRAPTLDMLLFDAVNLAGALLLLISLAVNFNRVVVILGVAWGIVAAAGMNRALGEPQS